MTAPPSPEDPARPAPSAAAEDAAGPRTAALLGRIAFATASSLAVLTGLLDLVPPIPGMTGLRAIALGAIASGTVGAVFGSALIALAGQLACLAMMTARRRDDGGAAIKRAQGVIVPGLAAIGGALAWLFRPAAAQPAAQDCFVLAACLLALAFLALIAERMVAAIRPSALPEAASLRALTLLPVAALALAAIGEIAMGLAAPFAGWILTAICVALAAVAAELAARGLARWFLPPPSPATARAPVGSLLAQMVAGSFGRDGFTAPIRAHFGIDFSRSWALLYLRAAALPALVLTALFCWALSGLVLIELDQRGVYERLGAPVGVLSPGLHLILPWPLGMVRRVEFGAVHEIALGGEPNAVLAAERSDAEAPPPPSATRLWDQPHPGEVGTLIASATAGGGTAQQSFQTVNADIRILYRAGLADDDALRAATLVVDPASLVRRTAGRRIARFFAVRTLAALLGDQRETIAEELRRAIAADLAPFGSGIEIVGIVVEAIHPPSGAAAAYHAVQAASIGARIAVAEAQGRAKSAANEARQQVRQLTDTARAQAAEIVQTAQAERVRFTADRAASEAGGKAFLLDRYFADLVSGFARSPLVILDHRLAGPAAPVIDLRPLAGAAAPPLDDPD